MFQRSLLSEADVEPLAEAVYTVLEKVGMLCHSRELLDALNIRGAKVDYSLEVAKFPRTMQEKFIEQLLREDPTEEDNGYRRFEGSPLPYFGSQVAQFFYDYEKRERRSGNKRDFINLIKLGDVLHPEVGVGHSLLMTEVPPILEPLEAAMLLAEYAHRPQPLGANVRQIDYLKEMGDILGYENWFSWGGGCFVVHPLRFDHAVAGRFIHRVRSKYPTGAALMPVGGISVPVTVAGFIVVASAELLAAWMTARALNPNISLIGSVWGGTIDMKTGETSYNSFDSLLNGLATAEFIRRWCNKTITVGNGEYCNAKLPGQYAALEKAYKAMVIAAFTGHYPVMGQGMLENGKTISPVQMLLERELARGVQIFGRTIEVTPEAIGLETILDVGFGLKKSYLQTRHTFKHYRQSLWLPEFVDRSGWNGFEKEKDILDRVQKKVNDLIAMYEKPEVDQDKLAKMRQVVKRAQKELL